MKSEQVVRDRIGSELQELDLALCAETGIAVCDLFHREAGLRQQRSKLYARRGDARTGLARHDAGGERRRGRPPAS